MSETSKITAAQRAAAKRWAVDTAESLRKSDPDGLRLMALALRASPAAMARASELVKQMSAYSSPELRALHARELGSLLRAFASAP